MKLVWNNVSIDIPKIVQDTAHVLETDLIYFVLCIYESTGLKSSQKVWKKTCFKYAIKCMFSFTLYKLLAMYQLPKIANMFSLVRRCWSYHLCCINWQQTHKKQLSKLNLESHDLAKCGKISAVAQVSFIENWSLLCSKKKTAKSGNRDLLDCLIVETMLY